MVCAGGFRVWFESERRGLAATQVFDPLAVAVEDGVPWKPLALGLVRVDRHLGRVASCGCAGAAGVFRTASR